MLCKNAQMLAIAPLLILVGCASRVTPSSSTLTEARRGFHTTLTPQYATKDPVAKPPKGVFNVVKYSSANGELPAYLTPYPHDGKKHPAIIWITGGNCNSIGDVWTPTPRDNEQNAAPYRKAGIVMMFPSLRGGNNNPGEKEGFLGEVDDVIAAAAYLEKQSYVDSKRIYLGGHSTGGTLALLTAECTNRFRAVFAFGPVGDVSGYGASSGFLPFDISNRQEVELRSPGYWLNSITSPVWAIEGSGGNIRSLRALAKDCGNSNVHFIEIQGASHFSTLTPTNELISSKILADTGATSNISLTEDEVNNNYAR